MNLSIVFGALHYFYIHKAIDTKQKRRVYNPPFLELEMGFEPTA